MTDERESPDAVAIEPVVRRLDTVVSPPGQAHGQRTGMLPPFSGLLGGPIRAGPLGGPDLSYLTLGGIIGRHIQPLQTRRRASNEGTASDNVHVGGDSAGGETGAEPSSSLTVREYLQRQAATDSQEAASTAEGGGIEHRLGSSDTRGQQRPGTMTHVREETATGASGRRDDRGEPMYSDDQLEWNGLEDTLPPGDEPTPTLDVQRTTRDPISVTDSDGPTRPPARDDAPHPADQSETDQPDSTSMTDHDTPISTVLDPSGETVSTNDLDIQPETTGPQADQVSGDSPVTARNRSSGEHGPPLVVAETAGAPSPKEKPTAGASAAGTRDISKPTQAGSPVGSDSASETAADAHRGPGAAHSTMAQSGADTREPDSSATPHATTSERASSERAHAVFGELFDAGRSQNLDRFVDRLATELDRKHRTERERRGE